MTIRDLLSVSIQIHTSGHHRYDIWAPFLPEPPYDAEGAEWVVEFGEVGG